MTSPLCHWARSECGSVCTWPGSFTHMRTHSRLQTRSRHCRSSSIFCTVEYRPGRATILQRTPAQAQPACTPHNPHLAYTACTCLHLPAPACTCLHLLRTRSLACCISTLRQTWCVRHHTQHHHMQHHHTQHHHTQHHHTQAHHTQAHHTHRQHHTDPHLMFSRMLSCCSAQS